MKVILMQELKGKGGEGDVIEVAQGFADNYLLPKGIAIKATKGNLKQLEQRMHNIKKREAARLETADDVKNALDGKNLTIIAKIGEDGQLFGSITPTMIAEAIQEQLGVEIDRKKIDLRKPIKTAGDHIATIVVYREIKAEVGISVKSEEMLAEETVAAEAAAAAEAAVGGTEEEIEAAAEMAIEAVESEIAAEAE